MDIVQQICVHVVLSHAFLTKNTCNSHTSYQMDIYMLLRQTSCYYIFFYKEIIITSFWRSIFLKYTILHLLQNIMQSELSNY